MSDKPNIARGYIELIRSSANFRNLWYGQIISQLGDWFNLIGSAALVAQLTDSGLALGGLFVARMLPPFVLSPVTGVLADRFNRRTLLIWTDVLRAMIVLGLLVVRNANQVWILYLLTVMQFSVSALWMPTRNAILPEIVSKDELVTANALLSSTFSTMLALGAALGGLVTGLFGIYPAFVIDSITFVISTFFVWQIVYDWEPALSAEKGLGAGIQQYLDGLRYLQRERDVLMVALLKGAVALAVIGGAQIVQVGFAEKIFPLGKAGGLSLGLMFASFGVGTGLGPLVARQIVGDGQRAMRWTISSGFAITGLGMAIVGIAPVLGVVLLGMAIRGIGIGIIWVFSSALMLLLLPEAVRGRVFASEWALFTLASAAGSALGGFLLDATSLDVRGLSYVLAVAALGGGIPWTLWLIRQRGQFASKPAAATPGVEFASD